MVYPFVQNFDLRSWLNRLLKSNLVSWLTASMFISKLPQDNMFCNYLDISTWWQRPSSCCISLHPWQHEWPSGGKQGSANHLFAVTGLSEVPWCHCGSLFLFVCLFSGLTQDTLTFSLCLSVFSSGWILKSSVSDSQSQSPCAGGVHYYGNRKDCLDVNCRETVWLSGCLPSPL